jgi:hypothetical protein
LLREPLEAMKEAAKIQAHELWLPKGMLTRRYQDFPFEPLVKETIVSDNANGMIFEGWSRKVHQSATKYYFSLFISVN